jgi:hypothetical protein
MLRLTTLQPSRPTNPAFIAAQLLMCEVSDELPRLLNAGQGTMEHLVQVCETYRQKAATRLAELREDRVLGDTYSCGEQFGRERAYALIGNIAKQFVLASKRADQAIGEYESRKSGAA